MNSTIDKDINSLNHRFAHTTLPEVKWELLPNKLKTIYLKDSSNPVLCLQLYIRTGSVKERKGQHGFSHFIEHLSFKSTREFPNNSISRYASNLGGMLNAFTDYDCTCYYLLLPSEEYASGLRILSQLAINSTFTAQDVNMEKDIILEEIKQYENDPEPDFIEYIQCTHFKKSPLKRPVLGTVDSVQQATYRSLKAFYAKNYVPENAFLVVCGDYEDEAMKVAISTYFGSWACRYDSLLLRSVTLEPEMPKSKHVFRKRTKGEEFLAVALPELCEAHPLSDSMLIAIRYLAIGKSSRLFKRLVEEDKLCSSVKVNSLGGILSGASVILICPIGRKHIPRILEVFKEEYLALMQHGIQEDELYLVKQDIIHSWLYSFEGVENTANLIAAEEFIGNLDSLAQYGDRIRQISMADVFSAMAKYWQPGLISFYHEGAKPSKGFAEFSLKSMELPTSKAAYSILNTYTEVKEDSALPYNSTSCSASIHQINDNHYQITLSNGMTVLFKQLAAKSVSGFALSTHISQLCETPEQRGVNFFASTLLLYGTALHTHEQLMRISREYGFNIRVIHHLDSTTFRGKCQTACLEKSLSMLADILYRPRFDKGHLSLLLSAALDGIRRDNDYPVSYAYQKWFKMLVGDQSNLYRSTGNPADIRRIKLKDLTNWYEKWDTSRDFSLGIVGSHTPLEVAELCERLFGDKQASSPLFTHQAIYQSNDKKIVKQHRETDQAIIHLGGFASQANNREENAAFHVLSHILGGDISSRFFDILREQYGFAYQTGFDFSSISELGFWNAYAFCDPKAYKKCTSLMQEIIADVQLNGVTEDELQSAKKYLIGMNRFDYESVSYTASSMSNLAALGYEPQFYINREARLKEVSMETINRIAGKYFIPSNQYLHILV